jgi:hypothetical protein
MYYGLREIKNLKEKKKYDFLTDFETVATLWYYFSNTIGNIVLFLSFVYFKEIDIVLFKLKAEEC